jgi:hypothetical protein
MKLELWSLTSMLQGCAGLVWRPGTKKAKDDPWIPRIQQQRLTEMQIPNMIVMRRGGDG